MAKELKLNLNGLEVQSFVTDNESKDLKGGYTRDRGLIIQMHVVELVMNPNVRTQVLHTVTNL